MSASQWMLNNWLCLLNFLLIRISDFFVDIGFSFEIDYNDSTRDVIRLEQDILSHIAGTGHLFVFQTSNFWSQIKSAG